MPPIEPSSNNNVVTQVTQTTKVGYVNRLGGAIKGIFFGLLIFIASFAVLYWNEGKVDKSNIASSATEINSSVPNTDTNLEGKLVYLNGNLSTNTMLGDDVYLKSGSYVALGRKVEVYAWVEESSTKTTNNVGGSQTQETTYSYKQNWVSSPADSSKFHSPIDHTNPSKVLSDNTWYATDAKVGVYSVDASTISLPSFQPITLNDQTVILPVVATTTAKPVENDLMKLLSASDEDIASEVGISTTKAEVETKPNQKVELNDNKVFVTSKGFSAPTVGDMRVSYSGIMSGTSVTILGRLDGSKISSMTDTKTGAKLYIASAGSFADILTSLHSSYKSGLWIFRIIGFLMMWIGLSMVLAPLSVLLDVLPLLGSVSRGVISMVTFVISLVLTVVTVIVSKFLHSPVAIAVAVVLIVGYVIYLIKKAKNKTQTVS